MAMPPGGGSSWHHTSDSYQLRSEDGALFGTVSVPVEADALSFTMPFPGTEWSSYYVFELTARAPVTFTLHPPLLPAPHTTRWTLDTPAEVLVPHGELWRPDARDDRTAHPPRLATITATPGAIAVRDARDRVRVLLRLGAADPAWPAAAVRGSLRDGAEVTASFCLPTGDGLEVRTAATSLP